MAGHRRGPDGRRPSLLGHRGQRAHLRQGQRGLHRRTTSGSGHRAHHASGRACQRARPTGRHTSLGLGLGYLGPNRGLRQIVHVNAFFIASVRCRLPSAGSCNNYIAIYR